MRRKSLDPIRTAICTALTAAVLVVAGLAAFPGAAIAGGAVFLLIGVCLAYDLRGLGARWLAWKRSLGGPTLRLEAWLDRTLDGAAVASLGVSVAWLGSLALV